VNTTFEKPCNHKKDPPNSELHKNTMTMILYKTFFWPIAYNSSARQTLNIAVKSGNIH
jgi:hypothetical protein